MPLVYPARLRSVLLSLRRISRYALGTTGIILLTYSGITSASASEPVLRPLSPAAPTDTVFWRLRGRVIDAYTAEPLPYAALWLKHLTLGTQSDEQGYFAFELSAEQLAAFPTDTLQVTAPAFRLQARALVFGQQPTDSLLRISLARDSAVAQHAPVLAAKRRGRPAASESSAAAAGATTASGAAPQRTFWQRLFGRRS
jgi:CarboxypepD_reg-like domain